MDSAEAYRRFEAAQVSYKRTIRTFARNCVHQLPDMDIEDIEQELLVILWKACVNYDPDRGASFNTLFQGSARNRVISLVRHYNTKGRKGLVVSLSDEDIAAAVADLHADGSAEDWYLAISEHGAAFAREAALA